VEAREEERWLSSKVEVAKILVDKVLYAFRDLY